MRACTALYGIYYGGPSWQRGNLLPVITADIQGTVNSRNDTQTILSPCVPETIDSKNKSLKYRRRWDANPSPLALQASALATRQRLVYHPNIPVSVAARFIYAVCLT